MDATETLVTPRRPPGSRPGVRDARRVGWRRTVAGATRVIAGTVRTCLRYRVTGLAAEAGFFALLSLPPLVLSLVASLGFAGSWAGADVVGRLKERLTDLAGTVLTQPVVKDVILPTFDKVAEGGRLEIASIGFLFALWSGSRALNVYVDTVSIMYGLGGHRGIVRTRALSFSMYVLTLVLGAVAFPLVLVGPGLIGQFLRTRFEGLPSLAWMESLYWPTVIVFSVVLLTTLYHVATPVRVPWRKDVPGAVLALLIWMVASAVLRVVVAQSVDGPSIYGPLAAPIVVLIWLYLLAIAVLIGAALNATLDTIWPDPVRAAARRGPAMHAQERPVTPNPRQKLGSPPPPAQ
jgi:membrane protein